MPSCILSMKKKPAKKSPAKSKKTRSLSKNIYPRLSAAAALLSLGLLQNPKKVKKVRK